MGRRTRRSLAVAALVAAAVAVALVAAGLAATGGDGLRTLLAVLPGVFVAVWYSRRRGGSCRGPWARRRED